jgi:hypothetical protein
VEEAKNNRPTDQQIQTHRRIRKENHNNTPLSTIDVEFYDVLVEHTLHVHVCMFVHMYVSLQHLRVNCQHSRLYSCIYVFTAPSRWAWAEWAARGAPSSTPAASTSCARPRARVGGCGTAPGARSAAAANRRWCARRRRRQTRVPSASRASAAADAHRLRSGHGCHAAGDVVAVGAQAHDGSRGDCRSTGPSLFVWSLFGNNTARSVKALYVIVVWGSISVG